MDRNQTESNPIKPVETAGENQKGAFGLERGCVQSTSRSTLKSSAASGVFQQAGFAKLLRLVFDTTALQACRVRRAVPECSPPRTRNLKTKPMTDFIFIAVITLFFVASGLYARWCEKL